MIAIHDSWKKVLKSEFEKEYFNRMRSFVHEAYTHTKVYPHPKNIFKAFDTCPFEDVAVVILGQDPYHGKGQANGLAFSVERGVRVPPSLRNIYTEIQDDVGAVVDTSGDLTHWAEQGVLLLNATLTVEAGKAGSHQGKGWEQFTDAVIATLSREREHIVFLLWGRYAREKGRVIDTDKHYILEAPHPSPFSAHSGFFGCKHFSKTNTYLRELNRPDIRW